MCGFGSNNGSCWIIFLLMLCGGCGGSCGCDTHNDCCNVDICTLCLILLLCCGGIGGNCDNTCGCGCGCN